MSDQVRIALIGGRKIAWVQAQNLTSCDPATPSIEYVKKSVGIFLDMTIHDFDRARFLNRSEVEEVYATGNLLVEKVIEAASDIDTALIV